MSANWPLAPDPWSRQHIIPVGYEILCEELKAGCAGLVRKTPEASIASGADLL